MTMVTGSVARATATTYYVDTDSGNDSNSGTSTTSPWATIDRASAATLEPGDRLMFRGGQTFDGNLRLYTEDAGTATNPVKVGSYGGGRASIDAGTGTGVSIYNAGGVEVSDLSISGMGYTAGNRGSGVQIYTDQGNTTKLEHIRADNLEVSGFGDAGVLLGAYPSDGSKSGFKDVTITNVVAHDNADAGIESFGYFSPSASGWAHENVYVSHCTTHDNRGVPDKGTNSGNGIVLGDVDGAIIEQSVSHNNGDNNQHRGGGPVGIWAWESNNVTIQNNESYDNKTATIDGGGFDLDGGVTNSVMQYNYSHGNAGAGYLLWEFSGARPFENNVVRYNISENDGRTNLGGIFVGGGVADTQIHNNTVYLGPGAGGRLPPAAAAYGTSNFHFRNNLFVTTGGAPLVHIPYDQSNLIFEGNNYWSSGDAFAIIEDGNIYPSLDSWRAATDQEKNAGLSLDPKLTDPGNGGTIGDADLLSVLAAYQLQSDSPMIDAASNLQSSFGFDPVSTDFYGTSIPQGAGPDIGAHEATSPPPPEPPSTPNTAPTITKVRPTLGSSIRDRTPTISATVRDAETDLTRSNIELYIDGQHITSYYYDQSTNRLNLKSMRLSLGEHTVKIVATDAVGLSETREWSFRIARRR